MCLLTKLINWEPGSIHSVINKIIVVLTNTANLLSLPQKWVTPALGHNTGENSVVDPE